MAFPDDPIYFQGVAEECDAYADGILLLEKKDNFKRSWKSVEWIITLIIV